MIWDISIGRNMSATASSAEKTGVMNVTQRYCFTCAPKVFNMVFLLASNC